jgi:hypothetical protein
MMTKKSDEPEGIDPETGMTTSDAEAYKKTVEEQKKAEEEQREAAERSEEEAQEEYHKHREEGGFEAPSSVQLRKDREKREKDSGSSREKTQSQSSAGTRESKDK